ncbi:MAG: ATP-binding cassette domain-containing protein [Azospirillaceae bacterium]|nr:ATP-binding cassette domain-containing protein [Azospirillaceae bacterium]
MSGGLLRVEDLSVQFPVRLPGLLARRGTLQAVAGISFVLAPGETLGVVGESGCGKSTLGRAILRLLPDAASITGRALLDGADLMALAGEALRRRRADIQMVFQDPLASLSPRRTVGQAIAEPLSAFRPDLDGGTRAALVAEMMDRVGLSPALAGRYPHEFSGGQCQRIAIARAMVAAPRLVVCDEAVSALDVSVQAQIVNLLAALQAQTGLSLLFISHDLAVVRHLSHRVMVLYLGRVMEIADRDSLYARPLHPYTQALLAAVPSLSGVRARTPMALGADLPSPLDPPSGCVFRTRCPRATDLCAAQVPPLVSHGPGRQVACHHPG